MKRWAAFALLLGLVAGSPAYLASVEKWRKEREAALKKPDGWLSVAGLFWLHEGANRVGSDPASDIVLPAGRAPLQVGVIEFRQGKAFFKIAKNANATLNGKIVVDSALESDKSGAPDLLRVGDFTMSVIERGPKVGVRLRDVNSKFRREFTTLHWYPVREQYRVVAKFTSYHQPQTLAVPNILGQVENEPSPGFATFDLMGHSYRLDPVLEDQQLFFIFRDLTSGKTTYGAGRFLYADPPVEGKIVLDFNKAYNPPCAFTPYATCPLPPKQNRLQVKIEAGELNYGDHAAAAAH
jgi:uncharacterized protein